jgi:hypothetical protein
LAFGSGDREGAVEAVDAFAVADSAHSGVAGGEGDEFAAGEVKVGGDFEGGEDAIIGAAFTDLESGEDESGVEEGGGLGGFDRRPEALLL